MKYASIPTSLLATAGVYVSTTSGVLPSSVVINRNTMILTILPPTDVGGEPELQWEHACDVRTHAIRAVVAAASCDSWA